MVGVQIENISKKYEEKYALADVSLSINEPGVYLIAGPNGSGKTTLLEIIQGMRKQSSGACYLLVEGEKKSIDRKHIGFLTQQNTLRANCYVKEEIQLVSEIFDLPSFDHIEFLRQYGLEKYYKFKTRKLSGGTQRRLLVALTLLADQDIVIMDEPVSGLDTFSRNEIWSMISEASHGRIIIVSDHYLNQACQYADYIYFIDNGRIVNEGSVATVFQSMKANYVMRCRENEIDIKCQMLRDAGIVFEQKRAGTVSIVYMVIDDISKLQALGIERDVTPLTFEDIYFYNTGRYSQSEEEKV